MCVGKSFCSHASWLFEAFYVHCIHTQREMHAICKNAHTMMANPWTLSQTNKAEAKRNPLRMRRKMPKAAWPSKAHILCDCWKMIKMAFQLWLEVAPNGSPPLLHFTWDFEQFVSIDRDFRKLEPTKKRANVINFKFKIKCPTLGFNLRSFLPRSLCFTLSVSLEMLLYTLFVQHLL